MPITRTLENCVSEIFCVQTNQGHAILKLSVVMFTVYKEGHSLTGELLKRTKVKKISAPSAAITQVLSES